MSLATGRYQLSNAFKSLKAEWESTDTFWRDIVRQEFAEQHWEPLSGRLSAVLTAMDRLDQALAKMKRECE
ncbi:MAG: hypothetical protein HYX68_21930 [Planctomycetes bacterium]|jgi:hypothetical protein|nr:hypothetical protein [Planctomycetota bacterium]